jgi:hypothetical protein
MGAMLQEATPSWSSDARQAGAAVTSNLRLPDFFIIGAQKSGTATLSALLAARSDVFISTPREPMFFCRDDAAVHPYWLLETPELWRNFDWQNRRHELLADYSSLFREATPAQRVGEGSVTYLVGRDVPARIATTVPRAKLIVLLRNPIDRAYSAYFHHLKNFRVVHSFEHQLKFEPRDLLETGNYLRHLTRYLSFFPREQLLILPFEQFTKQTQACYDRVCDFLELGREPMAARGDKHNEALVPRLILAQRTINYALRLADGRLETSALRAPRGTDSRPLLARAAEKVLRGLGSLTRDKRRYPALKPATRAMLREYFTRQNAGLSELVGEDLRRFWPEFERL